MSGTSYTKGLTYSEICSILEKLHGFKFAKLKFRGLEIEVSMDDLVQVSTPVITESSVGGGNPEQIIPLDKQDIEDIDDSTLIALSPEDFEERKLAGEFDEEFGDRQA